MTPQHLGWRRTSGWRRRDERGAAAAELAVVVPVLVMVIGLLVAGGRLWLARQAVEDASAGAARAASLARSPAAARQAAREVVRTNVATHGLDCVALDVAVDPSALGRRAGTGGTVSVSVSCTVGLSDVLVPGLPGSTELTATGTSAVDSYRGRR